MGARHMPSGRIDRARRVAIVPACAAQGPASEDCLAPLRCLVQGKDDVNLIAGDGNIVDLDLAEYKPAGDHQDVGGMRRAMEVEVFRLHLGGDCSLQSGPGLPPWPGDAEHGLHRRRKVRLLEPDGGVEVILSRSVATRFSQDTGNGEIAQAAARMQLESQWATETSEPPGWHRGRRPTWRNPLAPDERPRGAQ